MQVCARGPSHRGISFVAACLLGAALGAARADDPPARVERVPVPEAGTVARAEKAVADLFESELASKKPADAVALSERFRKQAAAGGDDAATRYVLLRRACTLAADGGDFEAAFGAADDLAAAFDVDVVAAKLETLTASAGGVRAAAAAASFTGAAATLGEVAAASGDFDTAAKASALATTASHRAKDPAAVARAKALAKRVAQARSDEKQYELAMKTLQRNPEDPRANLTAGRFLCLEKNDWAAGAPMLAKAADPAVKALGERERSKPSDADAMVLLGDAWWELPDNRGGVAQAQARQRAAYWYGRALPELKGLRRVPVEERLTEQRLAREALSPRLALERLVPGRDGRTRLGAEGLALQPRTRVTTPEELQTPVRIDAVVKTEKNNVRLYFGEHAEVIFNWEINPRELRVHDPATGRLHAVANQGYIEPGKWATITWLIEPRRTVVLVDGKQRAVVEGDYRNARGKAAVGAVDSVVTIKSWRFAPADAKRE